MLLPWCCRGAAVVLWCRGAVKAYLGDDVADVFEVNELHQLLRRHTLYAHEKCEVCRKACGPCRDAH